jgi:hypothetical protein
MKHVPTDDLPANYETIRPRTRGWLVEGLSALTADDLGLPVLVHSALGRDRCGIVVATALHLIGIPEQHIVDEYMASEGEVLPFKVLGALRGLMGFPQKLDPRIVPRLRASFAAK